LDEYFFKRAKDKVMKEQKNIRDKWLHLRLDKDEYMQLQKLFEASTTKKLSEYSRQVLLSKPVYKGYVDKGQQDMLAILTGLKKEINSIGINFNQVVRRLNAAPENQATNLLVSYELDKRLLLKKVDEIHSLILKTADRWLQK
jgi:hypothetical protein